MKKKATRDPFQIPYTYCCPCGHIDRVYFADSEHNGDTVPCSDCGADVTLTLERVVTVCEGHTLTIGATGSGKTVYDVLRDVGANR